MLPVFTASKPLNVVAVRGQRERLRVVRGRGFRVHGVQVDVMKVQRLDRRRLPMRDDDRSRRDQQSECVFIASHYPFGTGLIAGNSAPLPTMSFTSPGSFADRRVGLIDHLRQRRLDLADLHHLRVGRQRRRAHDRRPSAGRCGRARSRCCRRTRRRHRRPAGRGRAAGAPLRTPSTARRATASRWATACALRVCCCSSVICAWRSAPSRRRRWPCACSSCRSFAVSNQILRSASVIVISRIALHRDVDRLRVLAVHVQRGLVGAGQHERAVVAAAAETAAATAATCRRRPARPEAAAADAAAARADPTSRCSGRPCCDRASPSPVISRTDGCRRASLIVNFTSLASAFSRYASVAPGAGFRPRNSRSPSKPFI